MSSSGEIFRFAFDYQVPKGEDYTEVHFFVLRDYTEDYLEFIPLTSKFKEDLVKNGVQIKLEDDERPTCLNNPGKKTLVNINRIIRVDADALPRLIRCKDSPPNDDWRDYELSSSVLANIIGQQQQLWSSYRDVKTIPVSFEMVLD
jgi:hypothetical protein